MAVATRQPQSVGAIIAGYIDPKKTWYRGVLMRSRLEGAFARHLDELGVPWVYEPAVFGPVGAGYLPDFRIADSEGRACYVELKPTTRQAEAAKARIVVIWESDPSAVLLVVSAQGSRFYAAIAGEPWTTWTERWKHG